MNQGPTVFMPIETIDRELDARILVGLHLAEAGFSVVTGETSFVHALALRHEGGVYLGKNVFATQFPHASLTFYSALKERGFRVVHLDEEGAFFPGSDDRFGERLDQRLDPTVLAVDDMILTWGYRQRDHYRRRKSPAPVEVTGHPRFDLYDRKYEAYFADDVAEIRERHGDFVLINTTSGLTNSKLGLERVLQLYRTEHALPAQPSAASAWADDARALARVVDAATFVAEELGIGVVVRPHPGEDDRLYRALFQGTQNVFVRREGPVTPWILATRAVVHDGCTTSVEAHLAGVPVAVLSASRSAAQTVAALASLGQPVRALDDLEAFIRQPAVDVRDDSPGDSVRRLLANFSAPALDAVLASVVCMEVASARRPSRFVERVVRLRGEGRAVSGRLGRRVSPQRRERHAYARQKFYGFRAAGAERRIERMAATTGIHVPNRVVSDKLITFG